MAGRHPCMCSRHHAEAWERPGAADRQSCQWHGETHAAPVIAAPAARTNSQGLSATRRHAILSVRSRCGNNVFPDAIQPATAEIWPSSTHLGSTAAQYGTSAAATRRTCSHLALPGCAHLQEFFFPKENEVTKRQEAWVKAVEPRPAKGHARKGSSLSIQSDADSLVPAGAPTSRLSDTSRPASPGDAAAGASGLSKSATQQTSSSSGGRCNVLSYLPSMGMAVFLIGLPGLEALLHQNVGFLVLVFMGAPGC